MKLKPIHVAVAAALVSCGGVALADPSGAYFPASTYESATTDIFAGGSSAVDLGLIEVIARNCAPNTLDVYRTDATATTEYLMTCQVNTSVLTGLSQTQLALHKYTTSSSDGVNTVANGAAAVNFLQASDISAGAASVCPITPITVPAIAPRAPDTIGVPAYHLFSCGASAGNAGIGTLNSVNTFGFSDAEPTQFASASVVAQLVTESPYTLIFGPVVSLNVRNGLQRAQGLTVGSEAEADVPTLTSSQIEAVMTPTTATFADWTKLGLTASDFSSGSTAIYRARRSNGSGSTRIFDTQLIGDLCATPSLPVLFSAAGGATGSAGCVAGTTVAQLGTSDDMAACVSNYNAAGVGAIGYLSTDYVPGAGAIPTGFRFVKIDARLPTLQDVVEGRYRVWGESSLNYNKAAGISGDNSTFYSRFNAEFSNVGFIAALDSGLAQVNAGGWTGGFLENLTNRNSKVGVATPAAGPYTEASVLAAPQNTQTRYNGGYNLCFPALPYSGYVPDPS